MKLPNKKILITGSHRSGTTWLWHIFQAGNCRSTLSEPLNKNGKFVDRINIDCWFPHLDPDSANPEIADVLHQALKENCRPAKHALLNRFKKGKPYCLIKDPTGLFASEWYHRQFGTENIILIRHPAAFVFSIMRVDWWHPFEDFNVGKNLPATVQERYWQKIQQEAEERSDIVTHATLLWSVLYAYVADLYHRYKDNPQWHFVRHEDLSINPEYEISSLINKLGLRKTVRQRSRIKELCFHSKQIDLSTKEVHVMRRDSSKMAKKWKEVLSKDQIETIKKGAEDIWPYFYSDAEW